MRIAVVSDVHGHLPALDAVSAALGAGGADLTVDRGDLLFGYVPPAQLVPAGRADVAYALRAGRVPA